MASRWSTRNKCFPSDENRGHESSGQPASQSYVDGRQPTSGHLPRSFPSVIPPSPDYVNELKEELRTTQESLWGIEEKVAQLKLDKLRVERNKDATDRELERVTASYNDLLATTNKLRRDSDRLLGFAFQSSTTYPQLREDLIKVKLSCQNLHYVHDYLNQHFPNQFSYKFCDDRNCTPCNEHRKPDCAGHPGEERQTQDGESLGTLHAISEEEGDYDERNDGTYDGRNYNMLDYTATTPQPSPCRSDAASQPSPFFRRNTTPTPSTPRRRQPNPQPPGKLHRKGGKAGTCRQSVRVGVNRNSWHP